MMWIAGDEDGGVSLVCTRPACMKAGPKTEHNPRGLYYNPIPVLPYRPNPVDITRAWQEHRATHNSPTYAGSACADADTATGTTSTEGIA